ncbi:ABC transporter ATP-binding protein [Treponema pedis]|uniref:ABC transporter ATP-binding protein n=1 Tax=Treponema pedis TaxID=409322 RepID=UPI00041F11D3|nr:ABC transporter ATP-binding protein [Treponema pedis]
MFKAFFYFLKECWHLNWKFPLFLFLTEISLAAYHVTHAVLPKFIIEAIFIQKNRHGAIIWIIVVLGVHTFLSICRQMFYRQDFIQTNKTIQAYELKFAKELIKAKYEEIEKQSFLDKRAKARQYIAGTGAEFAVVLRKGFAIFGQILTLSGLVAIIFTLSPLVIISLIIIVIIQSFLMQKTLKPIKNYQLEQSIVERRRIYFNEKLNDFHYGKEIRSYGLADWFLNKYTVQLSESLIFFKKIGNTRFKTGFVYIFAMLWQSITAYYYLFKQAFSGNLTVANFTMCLAAVTTFFTTLSSVLTTIIDIQHFKILFKAYEEYINFPVEQKSSGFKPALPSSFDIEFQNVSFKYGKSEKYALQNVSVKFNSKERIAVIGENGAGKSTFVKLLMRLYEPTNGKILINGIDIKTIDYDYYQTWFAAVFQDFKLFSFSIKENITFGKTETEEDKKRFEKIVESTGLKEVIEKLDKGVDTLVYRDFDDAGFTPSGGQGQKIAIARAAYKNAPIAILDEPTAALDPKAENKIYEQFDEFFKDKCSLYISHRMAVTKFSDRTLVFDNAKIVQDGNHEELINQEGKYKELYELQAKFYV